MRQAEPPARVQRFPASVLLPLADDGCSDEGTRLLRGLSSLQREGKVVSRCVHTCVHGCVCVCSRGQPGRPVRRAWVCPAVTGRAAEGQGGRGARRVLGLGSPDRRC